MEGIGGKSHFLPTEDIRNEGGSSPSVLVNNETLVTYVKPLNVVVASQFSKNITDLDEAPSERDEVVLIDCSVAEKAKSQKLSVPLKVAGKRKQAASEPSGRETYHKTHKHYLKEINLEKLCDIHDKAYMRQVVLENVMIRRTRELMSTLSKAKAACDATREREKEKDKAYAELEAKWQVEKLHGEYSRLEIDGLKQDRVAVVAKVVPHVGMELVRSDEMGLLVARLVKTAIIHEFDQAGDNVATASYPFLAEATADPYAPLEVLLSNKPKSLRAKSAPSHSQSKSKPSSSKTRNPDN
ncbi:hypothetical protein Tco_0633320 [Tanacetum coccineum]